MNYDDYKAAMSKCSYFVSDEFIFVNSFLAIHEMSNIKGVSAMILDGDAGTGKTFLGQCLARVLDAELIKYQFTAGSGVEDLLFDLDIPNVVKGMSGEEVEKVYLDGVLPRAIEMSKEKKVVLLLDEIDKASPKIDAFLLDFLENADLYNPHLGELKANSPNLLVILTKNDERFISEPLMRRVRRLYLDFPAKSIEEKILRKSVENVPIMLVKLLVSLANRIRATRGTKMEPIKVPSTPEIIRCARDLVGMNEMDCFTKENLGEVVKQWLIAYIDDKEVISESTKHLGAQIASYFKQVN